MKSKQRSFFSRGVYVLFLVRRAQATCCTQLVHCGCCGWPSCSRSSDCSGGCDDYDDDDYDGDGDDDDDDGGGGDVDVDNDILLILVPLIFFFDDDDDGDG